MLWLWYFCSFITEWRTFYIILLTIIYYIHCYNDLWYLLLHVEFLSFWLLRSTWLNFTIVILLTWVLLLLHNWVRLITSHTTLAFPLIMTSCCPILVCDRCQTQIHSMKSKLSLQHSALTYLFLLVWIRIKSLSIVHIGDAHRNIFMTYYII